jgi:cell division GTPase FtsZ
MREYGESTNVEKPIPKHLGVIMTMPKRSEGSRVQQNALIALKDAVELVNAEKISTLIIVDNAKIHELYPGLAVKKFWTVANQNFAAILHTFNLLAAQDSEYNTFDRADFRSVIRNGLLIFGMTRVHAWEEKEDISQAVRQNLTGSLLADGFDLSKANMAGAIVIAHDDVLSEVPMENIDYAFNSLGRCLGNEGITLHSGIYEDSRAGMRVFTIVSGLEPPKDRFEELESLAT